MWFQLFLYFCVIKFYAVLCQDALSYNENISLDYADCIDGQFCPYDFTNCTTDGCVCRNSTVRYYYNATTKTCEFNLKLLLQSLVEKYDTEEQIRIESLKVFRGILISVLIFGTCATIGVISACIYCCRISYTDGKKNTISKQDSTRTENKKSIHKRTQLGENCNVVVGDAGVFVV